MPVQNGCHANVSNMCTTPVMSPAVNILQQYTDVIPHVLPCTETLQVDCNNLPSHDPPVHVTMAQQECAI